MEIRREVKTRWLLIIAPCLLCWTSAGVTNYNTVESEDEILYAIFKDRFKEPMEVIYFLMHDMKLFKVTSHYENKVSFVMRELQREFRQKGYKFSDIIIIIHNHNRRAHFSRSDMDVYRLFKGMGFEGRFCLYVYKTKKIYELVERLR